MRCDPAGESGIRVTLADTPSADCTAELLALADAVEAAFSGCFSDFALGYTTLTLFFDPLQVNRETLTTWLLGWDRACAPEVADTATKSGCIELPVLYAEDTGADLERLAREKSLSIDEVIACHSGAEYFAYANGFAPGFCYLGAIDPVLAVPRLATPRRAVPAGSVAIADRQTAVYPQSSPGGWWLLGRCPTPLFDLGNSPPTLINVGDRVRFVPISRDEYLDLGGAL